MSISGQPLEYYFSKTLMKAYSKTSQCKARLDRLQILSWAKCGRRPPCIEGFHIVRDTFVYSQTQIKTYTRCRQLKSDHSDTQIFWQYFPQSPFLKRWKITLVGDDHTGLLR